MKTVLTTLAVGAALLLEGCQTQSTALTPAQTTKFSIEGTEKFALLDEMSRPPSPVPACRSASMTRAAGDRGQREEPREPERPGELRCVFKDVNGFSTGDETPWQTCCSATAPPSRALHLGQQPRPQIHHRRARARGT